MFRPRFASSSRIPIRTAMRASPGRRAPEPPITDTVDCRRLATRGNKKSPCKSRGRGSRWSLISQISLPELAPYSENTLQAAGFHRAVSLHPSDKAVFGCRSRYYRCPATTVKMGPGFRGQGSDARGGLPSERKRPFMSLPTSAVQFSNSRNDWSVR